ncbi:MAG: hypothetical protein D6769_03675 [Methanobacteriota archaeon]|nr:MAG: hypothetical protein D6769_03675 [Euryarchaeota archaeon]
MDKGANNDSGGNKAENSYAKKTEEVVKEGGILARLYFDIHAKDAASLKDLAVGFSATLDKEEGVIFAISEIEEPLEDEKSFSTYITATVLFDSFISFIKFVVKVNPLSVEIIKPEEVTLKSVDVAESALYISSVIHDMKIKMYKGTLTPQEKLYVEETVKKRAELGKKLRGDGDAA